MNIIKDNKIVAIIHRKADWKEGLDFQTPEQAFCQVGTWWYQAGKVLKAHKHIENIRTNTLTQECVIVMNGAMRVDLYDDDNQLFRSEVLHAGDFMVMLAGGHGYEILEPNTKIIECKNGPFTTVEMDKEILRIFCV